MLKYHFYKLQKKNMQILNSKTSKLEHKANTWCAQFWPVLPYFIIFKACHNLERI